MLHHAESMAEAPGKRYLTYEAPVLDASGQRVWRSYWDVDTEDAAFDYTQAPGPEGEWPFAVIAREALAEGIGARGTVGAAESHLFEAADLVRFGVAWIERHIRG